MYVLSQLLELLALGTTLLSYHLKTKQKIFQGMCIANILDITHYLFLGAYSGCLTKVVAFIRNLFIVFKEKHSKLNHVFFLFLFLICYVVLCILTYQNYFSLLPFLAAMIYMIVVWDGNELQVKRVAFFCYFLWLVYNISVYSIVGVLSNIISLISTYIAWKNWEKKEKSPVDFMHNKR